MVHCLKYLEMHCIVKKGGVSSRSMYKGPIDKAKVGKDGGWEVGWVVWREVVVGKWRQLYLNNNINKYIHTYINKQKKK